MTGFGDLSGRRAIVLGGSGFLGRHICVALRAVGAQVSSVSRSDAEHGETLDLRTVDSGGLAALVGGADLVVNAAGRAWQATEDEMQETNAAVVERLAQAARGGPRLIQLGSVHEYGPVVGAAATTETQPTRPVTAYGRSKLAGAQAVLRATESDGLDGVVLRIANVCGPGTPHGSLLGAVAAYLTDDRSPEQPPVSLRLPVLRSQRDYVDVRDVAAAVVAVARAPVATLESRVVNIGRGEAVSVRWLVHRLIALSGSLPTVVEDPGARPGRADVDRLAVDISLARRQLRWEPQRSLDRSLLDQLAAERARPRKELHAEQRSQGTGPGRGA